MNLTSLVIEVEVRSNSCLSSKLLAHQDRTLNTRAEVYSQIKLGGMIWIHQGWVVLMELSIQTGSDCQQFSSVHSCSSSHGNRVDRKRRLLITNSTSNSLVSTKPSIHSISHLKPLISPPLQNYPTERPKRGCLLKKCTGSPVPADFGPKKRT